MDDQSFFWGEISQNFNLKNMISSCTNDFSLKNWPEFARFQRRKFKLPDLNDKF